MKADDLQVDRAFLELAPGAPPRWPAQRIEQGCGGVVGPAREILGCLLAYDATSGELVLESVEGRRVRLCVRPYHHDGPCRPAGPAFHLTAHPRRLREGGGT